MELAVRVRATQSATLIWKRKYPKLKKSGKGWVGAFGEQLSELMRDNGDGIISNDGSDALITEKLFNSCQQAIESSPVLCQLVAVDGNAKIPITELAKPLSEGWDEMLRPMRFEKERQAVEASSQPLLDKVNKRKASASKELEKPEKPEKLEKPEKPEKPEKLEKLEKPEKPEKPKTPKKPAKPSRPAKPNVPEKPKKPTA